MKRLLALVYVVLLVACSDSSQVSLSRDATIIAFGDSLTVSLGAKNTTYPQHLAQLTSLEVIASGVSGEQTQGGLARLEAVLEANPADALVLLEGGNDFLRNQPMSAVKANLGAMIALAQHRGLQVILVAVPQKSLFLSDAPIYQELAEQYRVVLVADTLSELLADNEFKSDKIHLNDQGYIRLAEAIAQKIVVR